MDPLYYYGEDRNPIFLGSSGSIPYCTKKPAESQSFR